MKTEPEDNVYPTLSIQQYGLTKLELFAAMAMQGLLADSDIRHAQVPKIAVEQADALIAELNKKGSQ